MRLEEWQKWLDDQFVEEAAPAEEIVEPAEPLQQAVGQHEKPLLVAEAPVETRSAVTQESAPPTAVAAPAVSNTRHESTSDEPDLPNIANYFPFLRGAASPTAKLTSVESEESVVEVESIVEVEQVTAANQTDDLAIAAVDEAAVKCEDVSTEASDTASAQPAPDPIAVSAKIVEKAAVAAPPKPQRHPRSPHRVNAAATRSSDREIDLWNLTARGYEAFVTNTTESKSADNLDANIKLGRVELITMLIDPNASGSVDLQGQDVVSFRTRKSRPTSNLRHQRTLDDLRTFKLADVLAFLEAQSKPENAKIP